LNKNNTAAVTTAEMAKPTPAAALSPGFIYKKIGNTKYRVAVHFSNTSRERMEDKIMRLAENDLNFAGFCSKVELPQTGRLLGGSI
jgi:hypothetical protein